MGWTNFNGGSEIDSGCIPNLPGGSIDASGEFYCSSNGYTVNVQFFGGTLPIFWATNIGEIVTTGARTAQVRIDRDVNLTFLIVTSLGVRNACAFPAYIARGRAKYVDHSTTGAEFCIDDPLVDKCEALQYNCKGELFSEMLMSGDCVAALEQPYLDTTWIPPNYLSVKYSNCTPFMPGGFPDTCQEQGNPILDPQLCGVPYCESGSVSTVSYVSVAFADCSASTPAYGFANATAPAVLQFITMAHMVTSGTVDLCDVRIDDLAEGGCSPCALVHSLDCVVTAVDAGGNVVIVDIPINA